MQLYCIRHGVAVSRGTAGYPDGDRPLTEEGIRKMKKAAKGMAKLVEKPDRILSSPLVRALETAKIVAKELNYGHDITITDALLPDADPTFVRSILKKLPPMGTIILVGHEPYLSLFVSGLLGSAAQVIDFKKGGMCRIDTDSTVVNLRGRLIYHLTPKQLRLLSSAKEHDRTESISPTSLSRPSHRRRGH